MEHEAEWRRATNILCIRLDSLGDVLMTSPALRALKDDCSKRKITLLTSPSGAAAVPLLAEVDQTIAYEAPWMKATHPPTNSDAEFRMITTLKDHGFDAAVIFTVFTQNPLPAAMLAFMANIPLRVAHCRENPYHLLTNWVTEVDHVGQFNIRHEVRRQLDLVAAVGSTTTDEHISIKISPKTREAAQRLLAEIGLDVGRPWLLLHPGASAASRRYPAASFAQAAQKLVARHGFQALFTGAASEVELVENIRRSMHAGSFSLAGRLNLEQLSAIISLAPVLISNNTGPVHIAAGTQTPVVDLYALTNPQHTPWKVPQRILYHDVPCKFCYKSTCPLIHHDCLRLVPPESVVQAALDLLQENQGSLDHEKSIPHPSQKIY
jgi:lipopolysaccharide heptosyltransferase II